MRMNLVVVFEGRSELLHDSDPVRAIHSSHVVPFERLHESFRHSVRLRAADGSGQRFQADLAGKRARLARDVGRAVVSQPLDGLLGAVVKPGFDRLHHEVAHHVPGDAAGRRHPAHCFPIAAVQRKGDPHAFPIVASDLEAIRAPAPVAFADGDPAVVAARVHWSSGVLPKQQSVLAHDAIDAFVVDPLPAHTLALSIHHLPGAPIAVGRQGSKLAGDLGHQLAVVAWPSMTAPIRPTHRPSYPNLHIRARYAQDVTHQLHRSSPGNKGERAIHFRSRATSIASLRISASKVFFPSSRCNSRIWRRAASSSAAGTTVCPASTAVSAPTRSSLRQWNNWFGLMPCRRATSETDIPASYVSRTIATFSGVDQRRLPSAPNTSTPLLFGLVIDTILCLSLRISEQSCPVIQGAISVPHKLLGTRVCSGGLTAA